MTLFPSMANANSAIKRSYIIAFSNIMTLVRTTKINLIIFVLRKVKNLKGEEKLEKPPIVYAMALVLQETILRKQHIIDLHIIFVLKLCGTRVWST